MNISQKAVFILSSFRFQIGLTMYLELFKRNPESKANFPFLKHLDHDDIEFYDQLKNHAIRVTGVLGMLIRQVRNLPFLPSISRFHTKSSISQVRCEGLAKPIKGEGRLT